MSEDRLERFMGAVFPYAMTFGIVLACLLWSLP